ncbi:hypothetical protein FQA39_LY00621 [Lamprigera yunnana]|nr:hypothetical protein FQA39_LY00621 [Lamprigera yunnana]
MKYDLQNLHDMIFTTKQVDNNSGHINDNCKDLKEQSKEIVDDVEENTKIVNKMIMNYKEGEYSNFQEPQNGFVKNYWGIKEESVMKSELYGTKFNHSLRQLEEELLNKVRIIEVEKFDEVVRILEIHYQCGNME